MSVTLAVVSPSTGPIISSLPVDKFPDVNFIVANDLATFETNDLSAVTGLVFIAAGGDKALMDPLFAKLPNCKWVHSFFAGVDALAPFIASSLLTGRGGAIPLTNGKGAFSDSLAEWVMTVCLHFNKQIPRVIENRKAKKWDKFVMGTVAGKTLGIVGFGDIGQCVAKMAKQAFGMKVLALRSNPDRKSLLADEVLGPADKMEVFSRSDFVVCALPGTPQTNNFCGAAEFAAMKKSGVFVSIGRGLAVDEDALAAALIAKGIGGAAVDVFKVEPLPETSPLWDCDNLILSSHNADFTDDYFQLGWEVFCENLTKFIGGEAKLVTEISKSDGY